MMFGNGEVDFYLMTEESKFALIKDKEIISIEDIRAATLFAKDRFIQMKNTGLLSEEDFNVLETLKKVYVSSLEYLYECAKLDLKELEANPRPTYTIIDDIIAFEVRIQKMEEMIAERAAAKRKKFIDENPEYVIHIGSMTAILGYVEKANIKDGHIKLNHVPFKAELFNQDNIEAAEAFVTKLHPEGNIQVLNIYEHRNLIGIKEHKERRNRK